MRNSLILMDTQEELDPLHAVIQATVQRASPMLLTALAAILAHPPDTLLVLPLT